MDEGNTQQYTPPPGWQVQPAPQRKSRTWIVWLVAGVGLAAVLLCGGGIIAAASLIGETGTEVTAKQDQPAASEPVERAADKPDPTPAGPETMQVGDIGTYTEAGDEIGELTVKAVDRFREPRSDYGRPPANDVFVQVTIRAKATGGLFVVNPFDFFVRDADGRQYEHGEGESLFANDDDGLNHTELNPGEQVTATLLFDAPKGDLELVYAPGFGRSLATWSLPKA